MAETDRLLASLRNDLPGALDTQIIAKLWEVVNEACRDGWIWRETITVPLTAGVQTYSSITPSGAEIVSALSVDHETADLTDTVYEWGILTLGVAPTAGDVSAGDAYVVAVLVPSLTAGEDPEPLIPSDMWSKHYELFRRGVLGYMYGQLNKPWTNPQLGQIYYRAFKSKLMEARREVETGGIRSGQVWRYPRWA